MTHLCRLTGKRNFLVIHTRGGGEEAENRIGDQTREGNSEILVKSPALYRQELQSASGNPCRKQGIVRQPHAANEFVAILLADLAKDVSGKRPVGKDGYKQKTDLVEVVLELLKFLPQRGVGPGVEFLQHDRAQPEQRLDRKTSLTLTNLAGRRVSTLTSVAFIAFKA
jgi:hypothetical protein